MEYTKIMKETVFTKIIKGEIPCHKIYEDEKTFVFLDIYPSAPGHMLVVPRKPVEFLWDLSDDDYAAVMATSRKVARHARDVLGVRYVGVKVIGTDVPHAHVHIIPFDSAKDEYYAPQRAEVEPDHVELAAIAEKLRFS